MSKIDRTDIDEQIAASIKNFSTLAKDEAARQRMVIEMPEFIQQKASLISAHFLLPSGSRIVDMACETGEISYVLAQLNPRSEIIGIDRNPVAIEFARKTYKLPNLSFRQSDIGIPDFEDESIDGIINSNVLHGIYSAAGYNAEEVNLVLEKQILKLKPGGVMLIRDYIMPPDDEFVLLELPNKQSEGRDPLHMSDADLLVLFSQSARPLPAGGCEGFFIEERVARREGTRLFRLPHKWAVEFVHRKNYRAHWTKEIKEEYTFFTWQDYRREFAKIGMRMMFSAPYWNPWVIKNCFKGKLQLYNDDYKPMNYPATNYFIVAQKVADKQSLILEERRPSQKPVGDLEIIVVRDDKSGTLHELVKRPGEYCDVVPYRVTPDNRIMMYVRSGYPRPIVNAVSRGSFNLDGKKWSGHLIEPITMDTSEMSDDVETNRQAIFDYVRSYVTLRPKSDEGWYVGETFFPSPDRIDEAIEPVFVEVENPQKVTWSLPPEKESTFTETGSVIELDAADIILASHVGLLPEPRLEMHAFDLLRRYNIPMPKWIGEVMPKMVRQAVKAVDVKDVLKDVEKTNFTEQKNGIPVQLKPVKAVFVEEGKVGRQTRGLSAQDVEFIVTDDGIENIAIVLPMTRDWDNNLLVALEPKILPVPNRVGGEGPMLNAPSFVLPKEIKTIDEAKAFIAGKFSVPVERVSQMGESFFTHIGVTPQRVYPFTVASAAEADKTRTVRYMLFSQLVEMARIQRHISFSGSALKLLAKTQMRMGDDHGMLLHIDKEHKKGQNFELSTSKTAVQATSAGYSAIPSRILGQRGKAVQPAEEQVVTARATPEAGEGAATVTRRLSQSYAQAKVSIKETPALAKMDKNIDAIGKTLQKQKPPALEPKLPTDKR